MLTTMSTTTKWVAVVALQLVVAIWFLGVYSVEIGMTPRLGLAICMAAVAFGMAFRQRDYKTQFVFAQLGLWAAISTGFR
jgi:hypothetical protein